MECFGAGYVFADRYQVVRTLGSGGMGIVFEVRDLLTERHRALKMLLPQLVARPELRARFLREARLAARVNSKYVVDVLDVGVDATTSFPYFTMELLHGENLGSRVARLGPARPEQVLEVLRQLGSALAKSHARGVIHRDLKPENIFCLTTEDGRTEIRVLDFGIAKLLEEEAHTLSAITGTPCYMAPEQCTAGANTSPATDIYAIGLLSYTLLTGQRYWEAEIANHSAFSLADRIRLGLPEPASARALAAGVTLPPEFDGWFARCTARDAKSRFASIQELVRGFASAFSLPAPDVLPVVAETAAGVHETPDGAVTTIAPTEDIHETPQVRRGRRLNSLLIAGGLTCAAGALFWMTRLVRDDVAPQLGAASARTARPTTHNQPLTPPAPPRSAAPAPAPEPASVASSTPVNQRALSAAPHTRPAASHAPAAMTRPRPAATQTPEIGIQPPRPATQPPGERALDRRSLYTRD